MKIIKPPKLKPGDKIGIISPSEPVIYRKKFLRGVETLKNMGFRVAFGKSVLKEYGAYMAGKDEERAADLNAMFRNPEIKGIFCSRGGMSANRLLGLLDWPAIKKNPKVFMGYSDITVLLNAIHKKTGLVTFHGPTVESVFSFGFSGKHKYTREYFLKALMESRPVGPVRRWREMETLKKGKARGALVGGNLSVLRTLIGTPYEPEWRGKILFWEEVTETAQYVDFCLSHLRLAGVFEKISGMVIGKLVDCDILRSDDDWKKVKALPMNKIVLELCEDYKFPIVKGAAFGHYRPMLTLPIGVKASIDTAKPVFSIDEPAVK
jgi:muramoyltetrapeptide carboxypeptidase